MRRFLCFLALWATFLAPPLVAQDAAQDVTQDATQNVAKEIDGISPYTQSLVDALKPRSGKIKIPEARVTLDLGDDYLFYGADDAKIILTDLWGNLPSSTTRALGLVMPAGTTAISDSWGAVIAYKKTGFISDENALEVDYTDLLEQLKEQTIANNIDRRMNGYRGHEIIGWAEPPRYNPVTHSVVWAREIQIDGEDFRTLNYDVRKLGRSGVLSMNLVHVMSDIVKVRAAGRALTRKAQFDKGARYTDFDPETDPVADYGVGGLVAAGVGITVAKKLGVFSLILKSIKPILIGIFLLIILFHKKIFGLFVRKRNDASG